MYLNLLNKIKKLESTIFCYKILNIVRYILCKIINLYIKDEILLYF